MYSGEDSFRCCHISVCGSSCASVARKCCSSPVSSISVTVTSARPCSPTETCSLFGAKCPVALQRGRLSETSSKTCAFTSLLYDTAQLTREVQTRRRPTFSQTEHYRRSRQTFPLRGGIIPALLRCWNETTAYNNDVYLLSKELLNLVASLVPSRYRLLAQLVLFRCVVGFRIDLVGSEGLDDTKVDTGALCGVLRTFMDWRCQSRMGTISRVWPALTVVGDFLRSLLRMLKKFLACVSSWTKRL